MLFLIYLICTELYLRGWLLMSRGICSRLTSDVIEAKIENRAYKNRQVLPLPNVLTNDCHYPKPMFTPQSKL